MHTASCLCGMVQLKLLAPLKKINICHCQQCQKAQGGAFAAITQILVKDLIILQGHSFLQEFYATPNKRRVFCKNCGSPIFSARLDKPEIVRLRVGIINGCVDMKVISHAYVDFRASWDLINDDAPQFKQALP